METVITRDTDILREYVAVLDSRLRDSSPFSRLAATVKLAELRRELKSVQIEATDDDLTALVRDIDERLGQPVMRRFQSRSWGSRAYIFIGSVLLQQLPLLLVLVLTALFVQFAPKPAWNPLLPREEPLFLYVFLFLFFVLTPLIAIALIFGGHYFTSWRRTVPATLLIIAAAIGCTVMTLRGKANPVVQWSSLHRFLNDRGLNKTAYDQWLDSNWLLKDEKFRRDYEGFLRNGPGRAITSRFNAADDAAWAGSLDYMSEYLDGGQDPSSFREWLEYYLERNRIYSEDRVEQEAAALTGDANERFLGVWQVEPYLKERDRRVYAGYMGAVNRDMRRWEMLLLGSFAVILIAGFLITPLLGAAGRFRSKLGGADLQTSSSRLQFPERKEITTPSFFDTPFRILARAHRVFLGRAVLTSVLVCLFFIVVYGLSLASDAKNPETQVALMRNQLLIPGPGAQAESQLLAATGTQGGELVTESEVSLAARIRELERRLEDTEYDQTKTTKEQNETLAVQRQDLDSLKSTTSLLQPLPDQVSELGTRTTAAESRAEQLSGEVGAARVQTEDLDKKVTTKLGEVEGKATRASEEAGRAGERASVLATRTDALERELDRRAGQIEARTEELGERTVALGEKDEKLSQVQNVALVALMSQLKSDADDLDRRTNSVFYRLFYKGDARRDAESLTQRLTSLAAELEKLETDEARTLVTQIRDLLQQVEKIAARVK
jgi:hypothetical protein